MLSPIETRRAHRPGLKGRWAQLVGWLVGLVGAVGGWLGCCLDGWLVCWLGRWLGGEGTVGGRLGIAWLVGWWVGAGYFVVGKVGWCVPGVRYVLLAGADGLLPRTCILLGWWQLVVSWLSGESYSENGGCMCGGISAPDN